MDKTNNLQYFLTDLADVIREKNGTSDLINAQNFADEIKNMSTGGVSIVDSVDKLDPNAPAGSVAAVATQGSRKTVSFKDLVKPSADIMDTSSYTINTEGLSVIDSVQITLPNKPISTNDLSQDLELDFCTENFNLMESSGIMGNIQFNIEDGFVLAVGVMVVSSNGQEALVLFQNNNGNIIVNEENVVKVTNLFNDNKLYYLSDLNKTQQGELIEEGWWPIVDSIIRPVAGIPSEALIYLKKDNWEPYAVNQIQEALYKLENKQDAFPIYESVESYDTVKPNTYYIATGERTRFYLQNKDSNKLNEYIIQYTNTGVNSQTITIDGVIWVNGIQPTVESGQTCIISIANSFGVYCYF